MKNHMTEEEIRAQRELYNQRTERLNQIIQPLQTARYECDMEWRYFIEHIKKMGEDYEGLEMDPDFQRGHVWTPEQQRHYIENVLRGVISTSGFVIQFNCPNWDDHNYVGELPRGFQCIDGLQRITAVKGFIEGTVKPFGLTVTDLDTSAFTIKTRYRFRVAIHNFTNKADLLKHYLDLNAGGTPHSAQEIERVTAMRESLLTKKSGPEPK
jgi:uncharacterized protein with ParB-like and HNH nuclease domain